MISHYRGHQEPRPASSHVIHAASTVVASAEDELLVGVEHGDVGQALRSLSPGTARHRPRHAHRRAQQLLPAVTLTIVAVTLLTWCTAKVTGGVIATAWVAFIVAIRADGSLGAITSPQGQLAFVVVAFAAVGVLVVRITSPRSFGGYA